MADTGATRRQLLKLSASLPAAAAAIPLALRSGEAKAQKTPKKQAQYQDSPKNGQKCVNCRFWQEADGDMGKCQVVAGKIHPDGWCALYTAAG